MVRFVKITVRHMCLNIGHSLNGKIWEKTRVAWRTASDHPRGRPFRWKFTSFDMIISTTNQPEFQLLPPVFAFHISFTHPSVCTKTNPPTFKPSIMALYRWWMFKIRFSLRYPSIMASTIHQGPTPCPSNHPSCSWETRVLLGFLLDFLGTVRGHATRWGPLDS